jgi:hypothetical protein
MPRFWVEVAGAGLARPGWSGQGSSDLRVIKMMLLRRVQGLEPAVACTPSMGADLEGESPSRR